ncbi:autoinducer binding domain-containing protein [Rhodovulum euryhalinum]|uniref:LuxR family transcriptional regulator n=1 Tax=Rhodovulum euryhalinum TaxID=35805 RepID=A0A4R2KNE7_9RHOB|nr:autoinducer binding domain-containing protein [Rhodovulum euryhalinum]TCO72336.1 LuxR family transcriptional regulator [Rhodovulum euryhalinum]
MNRVSKLAELLSALDSLSDTGFALAIHIRFTRPLLLYQSYSSEWSEIYSEKGLMLTDPVVRWGLERTGVLSWDDPGLDDPAGVVPLARQYGLRNGITISTGPVTSRTISGHTRSSGPFQPDEISRLKCLVETVHEVTEGLDALDCPEMEALRALDFSRDRLSSG